MKETMRSSVLFSYLMRLLMVVSVSGCTSDDDPYLRDEVSTTTRMPTEAENRMYHEIRVDMVKLRMLKGLGLDRPPDVPRGAPAILKDDLRSRPLPNYLHMKHQDAARMTSANRKSSRVIIFAELGSSIPCQVSKSTLRNYSPVSFKLPTHPSLIHRAVLQLKTSVQHKMRAWICPCTLISGSRSDFSNKIDPTGDVHLRAAKCHQLDGSASQEASIRSTKKGWSNIQLGHQWKTFVSGSNGTDRRVFFLLDAKMGINARVRPSLVLEVDKEIPPSRIYPQRAKRAVGELEECTTSRKVMDTTKGQRQDTCCRTGFYVDFEELGWSEWILSPPGFHFHFCAGHCRSGVPRGHRRPWTCCVPRKTSPLKLVLRAGRSSLNETYIPDFIVDDCDCFSRFME